MLRECLKVQNKRLWKDAFHDDDAFIDLYFDNVASFENTIYREENGILKAALQMLTYRLRINHHEVKVAYLSGIVTNIDYRNQGLASALIAEAHQRMVEENVVVSFLIPADFSLVCFYQKHGQYALLSSKVNRKLISFTKNQGDCCFATQDMDDNQLFDVFNMMQSTIVLTRVQFLVVLTSFRMGQGRILLVRGNKKEYVAMLFVVENSDGCYVMYHTELDYQYYEMGLSYLRQQYGCVVAKTINHVIGEHFETKGSQPYLMSRVVDVAAFCELTKCCKPIQYFDKDLLIGNNEQCSALVTPGELAMRLGKITVPPLLDE